MGVVHPWGTMLKQKRHDVRVSEYFVDRPSFTTYVKEHMPWSLMRNRNLDSGNGENLTDLKACTIGGDRRTDHKALCKCAKQCDAHRECIGMTAHPWGTMLKKLPRNGNLNHLIRQRQDFHTYLKGQNGQLNWA